MSPPANLAQALVLLVEDDRASREGVSRVLRRHGFQILGVPTAQEAIRVLGTHRIDVMVLDLGLPDADGAALLRAFRKRGLLLPVIIYTARILPSRLTQELSMSTHGIVDKAGSIDHLVNALEDALGGRWTPAHEEKEASSGPAFAEALSRRLDRASSGEGEIPVLDRRVARLQDIVAGREAQAVEEVIEIVGGDPRLAGAVLESVNSAFYGSARSVSDIRRACVQLGTKRVAALATEVLVRGVFGPDQEPFSSLTTQLWRESVFAAKIATRFATLLEVKNPDEVYTVTLLHNVGEFLVLDLASQLSYTIGETEKEQLFQQLGRSHERLGRVLMQRWELPELLERTCGGHHRDDERAASEGRELRELVLLGWELAAQIVGFRPNVGAIEGRPEERLEGLRMPVTMAEDIRIEAQGWSSQVAA